MIHEITVAGKSYIVLVWPADVGHNYACGRVAGWFDGTALEAVAAARIGVEAREFAAKSAEARQVNTMRTP